MRARVIPLERRTVFNYPLREPLGVVGVITPWNSPTFLAIMSLAPAFAAGDTLVLKPSEMTSASAFELARLAEEAGLPPGVVNVVTGSRDRRSARGSSTGRRRFVHRQRGGGPCDRRAGGQRLASCTLELGGKSPNIVFSDASLDQAVVGVLAGIFAAAGQTCVAGSRAYVQKRIYEQCVDRLARARQADQAR